MNRDVGILVIDDDPNSLEVCAAALEHRGYEVTAAVGAEAAVKQLRSNTYPLVITDFRLRGRLALDLFHEIKASNPRTKVIILTPDHDANAVIQAFRMGVDDYIFKPYDLMELWGRVAHHLPKSSAKCALEVWCQPFQSQNEEVLKMPWGMTKDIKDSLSSTAPSLISLCKGVFGNIGGWVYRKLNELHTRTKRLIGMTERSIGKATSVEGDENMEHEAMDLREDVVDPVLDELCSQLRESFIAVDNQLDLVPTNHIPVKGNRDWLRTVFRNLLRNAIDQGGKGCTVSIGMEDNDSVFKLNVINADAPLAFQNPVKLLSRLGHDAANGGMGLHHTREALKKHGRDIWYDA